MNVENKKTSRLTAAYIIASMLVVTLPIALDMFLRFCRRNAYASGPLIQAMSLYSPVIAIALASVLLYAKTLMQGRVSVKVSRVVNGIAVVVFMVAIKVLYRPLSFYSFTTTYVFATIVFYSTICSLIYDLFFRKR